MPRTTRILLVDADDAESHDLGRSMASARGWEIVRARTLIEAIRMAGDTTFDAAVLDTELPDGCGLDILDFLRIGSPGIQIVLLCATPGERIAFHALSHGAGDFLVKDKHMERELPGRIEALLHQPTQHMTIETLTPVQVYDAQDYASEGPARRIGALDAALADIVDDDVIAAGVWDLRGRPIAVKAPAHVDADGIGFALATLHGQMGTLWSHGGMKPTGYRINIEIEGGLLAVTAVPGTYVVALLFEAGFAGRRALDRADQAASKILSALAESAGRAGDDLPSG